MFPATFPRAQIQKCHVCNCYHHTKFNCRQIQCSVCFGIHTFQELQDNYLCPVVNKISQEILLQQGNFVACPDCKGLGIFQKVEEVSIKQHPDTYQKRLKQWSQKVKNNPSLQKPQPMVFRHSLASGESECFTCQRQGKVYKLKFCCFWGCSFCNFTRLKENLVWKKVKTELKKRDVQVPHEQYCTICTEIIPAQTTTYPTQCGHKFHKQCLLKWFKSQLVPTKTCPICRSPEEYFPKDYYEQKIGLSRLQNQMRINTKFFSEDIITNERSRSRDNQKKREVLDEEERRSEKVKRFKTQETVSVQVRSTTANQVSKELQKSDTDNENKPKIGFARRSNDGSDGSSPQATQRNPILLGPHLNRSRVNLLEGFRKSVSRRAPKQSQAIIMPGTLQSQSE